MIDEIEHNVNALEYLFSKVITYAGEGNEIKVRTIMRSLSY